MGGWLSPCTAITACNTTSSLNKVIWARRTKCYNPPILSCYYINTCSKLLPNKFMELSKTKAIARVPRPEPYSLYNYFTTHIH